MENETQWVGASPPDAPGPNFTNFAGRIERIVYFNEETGQSVLEAQSSDLGDRLLISGRLPRVHPGQTLRAELEVSSSAIHSNKGPLPARHLHAELPGDKKAWRKFLKSEAMTGIGPAIAKILTDTFPDDLLTVLELHPHRLLQAQGIGRKKQEQILRSWNAFKEKSKFELFLFERKLPLNWAEILWSQYQENSQYSLQENPYQIAIANDLEFEVIDSFALSEGFEQDDPSRLRFGLFSVLRFHFKQGHCAYPEKKLLEECTSLLRISESSMERVLELEILKENLIVDQIQETSCIYLSEIWNLEQEVARQLLGFQSQEPPWGWFNFEKVLHWAQMLLETKLAPLQKSAIEAALSASLTIVTGGPGTGKTTLIRFLTTILQTQFIRFSLCSPTGRAAQRLEEATGVRAQTIHRLLKYDSATGEFIYNSKNTLDLDVVLIDEVSMMDLALMNHVLQALPPHCALILVGDADQIPSIGAGNVLQSVIDCGRFKTVRLTDIFRQRQQSWIKINAQRINKGEMPIRPDSEPSDFHYYPVRGVTETKSVIQDLVRRVIPEECGIRDPRQFQILVPMNRGSLGTLQLNEELQRNFSSQHQGAGIAGVSGFGQNFHVGDKVMVIRNDYKKEVFNGDIGYVEKIDHIDQTLWILLENRSVPFHFDELDRLTLAYAISIHKSQGSEYKAVIVVVATEHLPIAQRHLIYTAVTRGKEHVFLVADPVALQAAIQADESNRRWQKLTELLKSGPLHKS